MKIKLSMMQLKNNIKQKPLISIIIVNFNGKKRLKICFDSLYSQTYKNFEIILVDNGSTDGSVEFIKESYPKVVVVRNKDNLGFSGGNNIGIKKANGEYILFLNNDTWVENDFLDKMMSSFINSDYDVIGPMEVSYNSKDKDYEKYCATIDFFGHYIYLPKKDNHHKNFYLSGSCLLFKKDSYLKSGGLDNDFFMYAEDWDLFWRLHLFKMKIYKNENIVFHHKGAGSTGKGIKYLCFLWRNQNTLQMLLKNYSWYNLLWVLPIYFVQNIFEIIFFLLIFKPKIVYSYIQGWWFNVVNFRKIMQKRKWVQENRLVSDYEIMKKMYIGFGKINHLINFYKMHD